MELHSFSDTNLDGIGQCSYLNIFDSLRNGSSNLMMTKSKDPPMKVLTVLKFDLVAAVLYVKVTKAILEDLDFEEIQIYF